MERAIVGRGRAIAGWARKVSDRVCLEEARSRLERKRAISFEKECDRFRVFGRSAIASRYIDLTVDQ